MATDATGRADHFATAPRPPGNRAAAPDASAAVTGAADGWPSADAGDRAAHPGGSADRAFAERQSRRPAGGTRSRAGSASRSRRQAAPPDREAGLVPPPAAPRSDPAAATAIRLHAAAIHLLRRLRREDATLGISAARLSALSVVGFGGPCTVGELAAAEQVTPPTMTRIVAALAADGLVARQPVPGDKRAARIVITATGRAILERGRTARTARLAAQLRALSAADLTLLEQASLLLERLTEPAEERKSNA